MTVKLHHARERSNAEAHQPLVHRIRGQLCGQAAEACPKLLIVIDYLQLIPRMASGGQGRKKTRRAPGLSG